MPARFRFLRSVLMVVLIVVSIPFLSAPQHSSFMERMTTPPAAIAQSAAPVGPQPGDVFRQFQDDLNSRQTSLCNSSPANCGTIPSEQ
jgi:hypothetical protein